ncbi:MAG: hypothetical protein QM758_17565 [Armatimonas sp.]
MRFFQTPPPTPGGLSGIASALNKPGKAGSTKFQPSGKPILLNTIADALGQTAEQKKGLRDLLNQGAKAVEGELAKAGHPNEAAAGLTFGLVTCWNAWSGQSVSDPASEALLKQLEGALDTPAMKTDTEKQKVWEWGVGIGVFITTLTETAATDPSVKKNLKPLAGIFLTQLLGVGPEKFRLTEKGLTAVAGAASAPTTSTGALSLPTLPGWTCTNESGGVIFEKALVTQNKFNEPLIVRMLLIPGAAQAGDPAAMIKSFYDRYLRPQVPADIKAGSGLLKDALPDTCRRLVGNGLRCWFAGVSWSKREDSLDYFGTTQERHLYAIESAGKWYPVFVALIGMKGADAQGKQYYGRERHDWLEQALMSLKGTPSGKPLYTAAELAGAYSLSSSTLGPQYYNALTGASLGNGFVSRGIKLNLLANGTYTMDFAGASNMGGGTQFSSEKQKGPFRITTDKIGAFLVRRRLNGQDSPDRLVGFYRLPDGRKVLITLPPGYAPTLPNLWGNADRYFTK